MLCFLLIIWFFCFLFIKQNLKKLIIDDGLNTIVDTVFIPMSLTDSTRIKQPSDIKAYPSSAGAGWSPIFRNASGIIRWTVYVFNHLNFCNFAAIILYARYSGSTIFVKNYIFIIYLHHSKHASVLLDSLLNVSINKFENGSLVFRVNATSLFYI